MSDSRPQSAWIVCAALACAMGCDTPAMSDDGGMSPDGGPGCDPCVFEPFELLADPYLPARLLPGLMQLASSLQPEPPEGEGNDDYNHYLRIDGEQHVLMEAEGPGVVTRLWFTGREPASQDYPVLDRTVLHAEIDGVEVVWAPGGSGISLETLTSGTLPSFPRPWVAGRDTASNGFIVSVPIAFARSIRLWIDEPPGIDTFVYYQVDWRELPADTEVRSFDGMLTAAESAALEAATDVWIERGVMALESTSDERTLAPSESMVLAVDEPTTVRAVAVAVDVEGGLGALEGELFVDGESIVSGPVAQWTFASPPTEPGDSALSTVGSDTVAFRYPFPVRAAAELRLRNSGAAPVTAQVRFEHDPGSPDPDLGALRASCGTSLTPAVGQNLALLDLTDRRGHYAGQFLVVRTESFWVLEGDHEVAADDVLLLGTGLEDYFGGSFYYLRGAFAHPLSGASGRAISDGVGEVSQYRHHLLDTIPFQRRFRFDFETFLAGSTFERCIVWYEAP
jgi:hypothetical protein